MMASDRALLPGRPNLGSSPPRKLCSTDEVASSFTQIWPAVRSSHDRLANKLSVASSDVNTYLYYVCWNLTLDVWLVP